MWKSNYDTTIEKLLCMQTGSNLILSHSQTLCFTRIISPTRNQLLNNLRKITSTPRLMTTTITHNKFYCPASWRLPILHLPLLLIHRRKQKFPLVYVLKICQLLLLSCNKFYLTTHPRQCALAHAHTRAHLHTPPPPKCASSCHRSRLAAACFARGGGIGS